MISPEQALKLSMLEKQHGLPSGLLKNVMTAESAGDPNAVSPKGAMGYFQFMPQTAAEYGVQDPTNFDQSATGAARMYADLSRKYNGDLPSMLAAYNWGQGNVDRKGLENAPAETRGYIAKIMGAIGDAIVPPANAADLSGYSDEELMQIAAQGKKDVSQMTADEELAHAGVPVNEPDLSGYSDEELMKIAQGVNQKQAAPQEEISLPEAMASNLAEGLTSGFAKKAVAGLVSGISGAPYEQVLQAATDRLAQGRAQHPYAAGINDVLGSIGGLLGGGYALAGQAPKAASALAEFAKLHPYLAGMGGGAVAGAARSAGDSVGSTDVASDMLGGAVRGLAAGGVGAAIAPAIGAAAGGLVGGTRAGASALTKLAERFGLKAESGKAGSVIQNLEQGAAPEFTVPPAGRLKSRAVPTSEDVRADASALYSQAEAQGGVLSPEFSDKFVAHVQSLLPKDEKVAAMKVYEPLRNAIDDLSAFKGEPMTLQRAQAVDEAMSNMAEGFIKDGRITKEGKSILDAQTKFRDMIANAGEADVVGGKAGFEALAQARKEWARSLRMADIERIIQRAEMTDAPAQSIKAGMRNLLMNKNRMRGYSPEEKAAIRDAANTGIVGEGLRLMGSRLVPIIAAGGGYAAGGVAGLPAAAAAGVASGAARKAAEKIQVSRANDVLRTISGVKVRRLQPKISTQNRAVVSGAAGAEAGRNLQGKPPTITIRPNKRGAQ